MNFILYDVIFLVLFILFLVIFLYARRKNLKREGLLYLYRTKFGLKVIDFATSKFSRLLKPLQYVVIASGYVLMTFMIWLLVKFGYFYLTSSYAAKAIKMPVIMPLIPYLPEIFKIDYLPPFYFTYWIIIIAIIAIPHEFAHGIFAKLNKIRILSTGFGFLGPFLAAFVEQDDKQMQKSTKFSQLSVLAAGTFANLIFGIIFTLISWLFFVSAFTPAGVNFNTYAIDDINVSSISSISNISMNNQTFLKIIAENKTYFADLSSYDYLNDNETEFILAYDDSPAFNAGLIGAIAEIDGKKITSYNALNASLSEHRPGDRVTIKTIVTDSETRTYDITLSERNNKSFLGIGIIPYSSPKLLSFFYKAFTKVKDPYVYYSSKIGNLGIFIGDLLWWLVVICFSVALMNMLPAGIFDGGRFFFLTIWGITGSKTIAEKAFKISTYALLALLALMLVKWVFAFI